MDDFAEPGFRPQISERWRAFLEKGEQQGTLLLVGPDGGPRDVEYTAKRNVLPVRHLVVLRDKTADAPGGGPGQAYQDSSQSGVPAWVRDYALFLLNVDGHIATWYSGAERIYGYQSDEAVGQPASLLYGDKATLRLQLKEELKRALAQGHLGTEGWQLKRDGSRFWANTITMALRDDHGELQGFARVVRDFTERHQRDEKLRRSRARIRPHPLETTIVGIVSGEFDRIPEANEAFLDLVGYSRDDLLTGRLRWPDLTPPEYLSLDDIAHEEGLRFGACTPFEKS